MVLLHFPWGTVKHNSSPWQQHVVTEAADKRDAQALSNMASTNVDFEPGLSEGNGDCVTQRETNLTERKPMDGQMIPSVVHGQPYTNHYISDSKKVFKKSQTELIQ